MIHRILTVSSEPCITLHPLAHKVRAVHCSISRWFCVSDAFSLTSGCHTCADMTISHTPQLVLQSCCPDRDKHVLGRARLIAYRASAKQSNIHTYMCLFRVSFQLGVSPGAVSFCSVSLTRKLEDKTIFDTGSCCSSASELAMSNKHSQHMESWDLFCLQLMMNWSKQAMPG